MSFQLQLITKQKEKALKVLVETKKKLESCRKMASDFLQQNSNEIVIKHNEIVVLEETNKSIRTHIQQLDGSIAETDKILNPEVK